MKEQKIDLVGLTIETVRGDADNDNPMYILFSDGETVLEFTEQDELTYHDASPDAYEFCAFKDKREWKSIFENTQMFPEIEMAGWITEDVE
jgi:hypothetical protein